MSNKSFWVDVLTHVQPLVKQANFLTWFKDTTVLERSEQSVKIGVPNAFAKKWLEEKYKGEIIQALKAVDCKIEEITVEVDMALTGSDSAGVDVKKVFSDQFQKKVRKVRNMNEVQVTFGNGEKVVSRMLNERYSLDNFVVSRDNRLAHAACEAVVNMPGGIYNPLYIYGEVGMGKTHLLQAIGNGILENHPDLVVKYITAERFVTEVVDALGKRQMKAFKDRFRNVDCFIVDDVQFFARKETSQQELFHTFNELYEMNKQIVLASDCAPSAIDDLDERLKSRFAMGMVVELTKPDFEARLKIVKQKALEHQLVLMPEVLEFVASNVTTNVRVLEGVLKQIVAEMQLFDALPTMSSVARIIKRLDKAQEIIGYDLESEREVERRGRTMEDIIAAVCKYYNLEASDLTGQSRQREMMLPRQLCVYLMKNELGHSYERIGAELGGRNHTTILHSYKKIVEVLKKDLRLMRDLNLIKQEF